ncbi:MAG TPA: hypothetical protein ENN56_04290 [Firmicutes bacterium]|nr:hypothetical protein [Bacillota bacterium]
MARQTDCRGLPMKKVMTRGEFWALMDRLVEERHVVGVVEKSPGHYVFDRLKSIEQVANDYLPTILPPKKYLLPQTDPLFRYNRETSAMEPVEAFEEIVVFGVRPCDITALAIVTERMLDGEPDEAVRARRDAMTIIGWDCKHPCDEHSFCESVGSLDPDYGYDVLVRDIGGRKLVIETGSPKGDHLVKDVGRLFDEADKAMLASYMAQRNASFPKKLDIPISDAPLLFTGTDENPFWDELADKCYSCGTCTTVCPTCYCFDVHEEIELDMKHGTRVRTWDSCQLDEFAEVATGENFREERVERVRHRLQRKFNYQFTRTGQSHCVGCGRCARACLVGIDPVDVVNTLAQTQTIG